MITNRIWELVPQFQIVVRRVGSTADGPPPAAGNWVYWDAAGPGFERRITVGAFSTWSASRAHEWAAELHRQVDSDGVIPWPSARRLRSTIWRIGLSGRLLQEMPSAEDDCRPQRNAAE